ncbi:MAG: hypothetical protein AW09_004134 [Candidatus Accumulibacter phosphatis]|jgi:hypothetical protein|uniref:Uncharacterized protein n=1 Tax=Candidatus Accumulibacter phosphatis TaxID=327160 RepID=A0A080LT47_9PROT|nr:Druantia anti-phage system protein DruA [Accumulibacter sp.]KFB70760.1 MAG: hypothetical protein AW09_004134 [Candidatus Accumulibacter phosphatis]HRF10847.1 DUF4338 domain-containing protein [Candidatus Accumulibacter phosphatis]
MFAVGRVAGVAGTEAIAATPFDAPPAAVVESIVEESPVRCALSALAPVYLDHYAGTCYRAAGWQLLGETSGRGLARPGQSYHSAPRKLWVKPLTSDCCASLCAAPGNPQS